MLQFAVALAGPSVLNLVEFALGMGKPLMGRAAKEGQGSDLQRSHCRSFEEIGGFDYMLVILPLQAEWKSS